MVSKEGIAKALNGSEGSQANLFSRNTNPDGTLLSGSWKEKFDKLESC